MNCSLLLKYVLSSSLLLISLILTQHIRLTDASLCPIIKVPTNLANSLVDSIIAERRSKLCRINCNQDINCGSDEKCCSTSCGGRVCVGPVPELIKAGSCPFIPDQAFLCKTTVDACSNDASCPFDYKCCSGYCGKLCIKPEKPHGGKEKKNLSNKPGFCPKNTVIGTAPCQFKCIDDSSCEGSKKCCSRGCSLVCLNPVRQREDDDDDDNDECPPNNRRTAFTSLLCSDECTKNFMCPRNQICCPVGRCLVCTRKRN